MKIASTLVASAETKPQWREGHGKTLSIDWPVLAMAVLVLGGCSLGSQLGVWLKFPGQGNAILFPPYAVLTAALLLSSPRTWWIYLLASLVGHVAVNSAHWTMGWVLGSELANDVKAVIAAWGIGYFNRTPKFDSFRRMEIFLIFAVFVAPATAALAGAAIVVHYNPANTFWLTWRAWFLSNALTGATMLPALLTGITNFRPWLRHVSMPRLIEAVLLSISLVALSFFALTLPRESLAELPSKLYALLPILLWAAVRFGSGGTSMAILGISFAAIAGAMRGQGPFTATTENLLSLQLFLIIVSIPVLFLAALIEERSRTEEKLREREERIGLAAETANLALWTIDFERNESWMSDKGRELFGFAPNERLSREIFLSRVHSEDRDLVDAAIEQARGGSQTFEIEYRLLRPDGKTRSFIARGRYLRNARGAVTELLGVAMDVTSQVEANLELHQRQNEMARLNRLALMGELTASIAHELNQPLTAIASNAAAGKRYLIKGSLDPKMFEELLEDVFIDARRAGDLIHGVRDLVRMNQPARRPVNLNELVLEVLHLMHSDLLGRSTIIATELADDLAPVQGDPIHLQQVLLNLIMNALEAMQEKPTNKRRILLSTGTSGESVLVSVRDYGVGLPESEPDKVFSKFFSTKPNGMGMGLAIARSIVEAHGGELSAENLADGARFSIRLPSE